MLRRCCPPSFEGAACCQSPHKPRGAAAVLPFFSARAEEAARCQCLRGWAQAVGRVTPSLDGGPPWFSWGMWQEGQPLCRGGQGASARTIFRLRAERLPTLLHRSILGERMLPNKVASAWGIHAMPAGVVGVGAYTPTLVSFGNPGTNLLGPRLSRHDAKTNPPGTLRKCLGNIPGRPQDAPGTAPGTFQDTSEMSSGFSRKANSKFSDFFFEQKLD